jgi:hypothetical protein
MKLTGSYELQLDPSVRRMGLANLLMDEMESIGRRRKLDKSMLTCLKGKSTHSQVPGRKSLRG